MDLAGGVSGARARVRELLDRVGLAGRFDHYPVQLSGGEQQCFRVLGRKPLEVLRDE
jgi:predicted ABC-type transport system involved in lysophospholipase L1 biosynthesis ATPase subunit